MYKYQRQGSQDIKFNLERKALPKKDLLWDLELTQTLRQ